MGLTYTTVCERCGSEAPEVGDFGFIGTPSLDTRRTRKHTQSFGYLYAGLAALGLLTEEIEAFRAFLESHRGHALRQFSDAGEEAFGDDVAKPAAAPPRRARKPVSRKGKLIDAFHELACASCDAVQRGSSSARLRSFASRTLAKGQIKLFQTNCADLASHTYRVGGFPYDDVELIALFLRRHAGHRIVARLTQGEKSAQPKALRKAPRAPSWTPPEWKSHEHEAALARTRNADVRAALLRLRHRDPGVRAEALSALRAFQDRSSFGHVASMWRDPEPRVRAAALVAIGALDDPRRARVLGHALFDESQEVRSAAERALQAATLDQVEAARLASAARAPDTRPEVKKLPDDLSTLRASLLDPNSWLRATAAEQLAKRTEKAATDALLEALADPDVYVRSCAAKSLTHHGARDARVAPALLQTLHDYGKWVVTAAVTALGELKVEEAVPLVRERLLESERDYLENTEALERIGGPAAIEALGAALAHPSVQARSHAACTLGKLQTEAAANHLVRALADPAEEVRTQAAYALGEMKNGVAIAPLVAGYAHPSEWDRHAVVGALGKLGGPEAIRVLVDALQDGSRVVRRAAAAGLTEQNDAGGNQALVAAARRGDSVVAAEAWRLLLGRGDPGTEQALADALGAAEDEAATMAASFLQCGNALLASRARSWLEGQPPPKSAPRIKWGSRRSPS